MNGNLFGKNLQIIAYRSPAHEIFSHAVVTAIADRKIRKVPKIGVIGNFAPQISDLILATLAKQEISDHQSRALKLRDAITAATEAPIWHVLVGTHFRVAFPSTVANDLAVHLAEGGCRVLAFRHQQDSTRKAALLAYLPVVSKVLMVVFCMVLMFQSRLGLSEKWIQILGTAVLALAVMKVLYAYLMDKTVSKLKH
jgi:hypothetical protein